MKHTVWLHPQHTLDDRPKPRQYSSSLLPFSNCPRRILTFDPRYVYAGDRCDRAQDELRAAASQAADALRLTADALQSLQPLVTLEKDAVYQGTVLSDASRLERAASGSERLALSCKQLTAEPDAALSQQQRARALATLGAARGQARRL